MFSRLKEKIPPGVRKKAVKVLLVSGCLIFCLCLFFSFAYIYVGKTGDKYRVDPDDPPEAQVVIVPGALVYGNGLVSDALYDRVAEGVELYKKGRVKKILLTGDHGTRGYDEVNGMKKLTLKLGVPEEDIFLDHAGFNTYESMYRAKAVFNVQNALVVTQDFHLSRSVYLARKSGIEAWGVEAKPRRWQNPDLDFYNIRETFSRIKAFISAEITKPKPTFLGPVIPIEGDGRKSWD